MCIHMHIPAHTCTNKNLINKQTKLTLKYILKSGRLETIKLLQETDEETSVTLVVEIVYGIQQKISHEVKWKQKMGCFPSQVNCHSSLPAFPMNNLTQCYG